MGKMTLMQAVAAEGDSAEDDPDAAEGEPKAKPTKDDKQEPNTENSTWPDANDNYKRPIETEKEVKKEAKKAEKETGKILFNMEEKLGVAQDLEKQKIDDLNNDDKPPTAGTD